MKNNPRNTTNPSSVRTGTQTVSLDGYVRLSPASLMALSLRHFLSGLDDDIGLNAADDGTQALICGYTEWLSTSAPAVTIGWDWHLDLTGGCPRYVRTGCPRSNIMLIDEVNGGDLGHDETSASIILKIDQSGWEDSVQKHISMRYA